MPEECPVSCVAVYFCNYDYVDRLNSIHHYGDYKEIEDVYFVKDFTVKEFNEECKADYSYWGRTKYDHTETLTIPQEVFENAKGVISFFVTEILYIPSEKLEKETNKKPQNANYTVHSAVFFMKI